MVRKIRLLRRRPTPVRPRRLEPRPRCVSRVHRRNRRLRHRLRQTHRRRPLHQHRLRARCLSRRSLRTSPTLRPARVTPRARAGRESLRRPMPCRLHREASVRRKIGRTVRRSAASRKASASAAILRATTCPRAQRRLSNRSHRAEIVIQRRFSARASLRCDEQNSPCADACDPVRRLHDIGNVPWTGHCALASDQAWVLHLISRSRNLQHISVRHRFPSAFVPGGMHGFGRRRRCAAAVWALGVVRTLEGRHVSPVPRPLLFYSFRVSLSA